MKHEGAVITREDGDPEVRVAQGWLVPTGVGVGEEYATVRAVDYAALQAKARENLLLVLDEAKHQAYEWDRYWEACGCLGEHISVDDAIAKWQEREARLRALVEAARPLHDAWKDQLSVGIEMEPKGTKILVKATDMAALAKAVKETQC